MDLYLEYFKESLLIFVSCDGVEVTLIFFGILLSSRDAFADRSFYLITSTDQDTFEIEMKTALPYCAS